MCDYCLRKAKGRVFDVPDGWLELCPWFETENLKHLCGYCSEEHPKGKDQRNLESVILARQEKAKAHAAARGQK